MKTSIALLAMLLLATPAAARHHPRGLSASDGVTYAGTFYSCATIKWYVDQFGEDAVAAQFPHATRRQRAAARRCAS